MPISNKPIPIGQMSIWLIKEVKNIEIPLNHTKGAIKTQKFTYTILHNITWVCCIFLPFRHHIHYTSSPQFWTS